jgi:two-component system, NtrC family, sensor kinase
LGSGKTIFTLKTKLALLFLTLALVPLCIIGAYAIHTTERLIVDLVLRQLENAAADKAALLERWLVERKADMQVLAGTSLVKTMDPRMIAPYFHLIQSKYGVYKDIAVVDGSGNLVFSNHGGPLNVAVHPWSRAAAQQTLYLSEIAYLPEQEESTFTIAAPVLDGEQIMGAVYGTVGTSTIIYSILNIALGVTGECYLVDQNGTFLAHKEPHRILKENISQSDSFKNIFGRHDQKKPYLDYRGVEVLGRYQKVSGTQWYLVVEQDRDEAFESVDALRRYLYVTVFLSISCAFVLTWIIARHFVSPIRALARSADILADSQTGRAPLQTQRQDEIGALCRAFENMALKVRERQDGLEQKVSLKEAELKEIDLTLKQIKIIAERSEKFAAIGRLGAAVAHEIRTPLASIKLFLESVQSEIEISSEYEEDFSIAMGQITRIEAAINRLLDFTKPQDLVFDTIGIAQLVQEVVFMIRPMANKQACVLETHMESDLPNIEGDKRFLEEALINLLINALEAIPAHGRISITASRDHFDRDGRNLPCIRIDVADNGHGISAEAMKLLFEPFFTTKTSGTGLGLPLVYHTVKRHGGLIRVDHQAGGGAVFSIFLPLQTADPEKYGKNTPH